VISRDGRREDLEGDLALQLRVGRSVHLTHAASAQLGEDLVRTYRFPNRSQILTWAPAKAEPRDTIDEASEGGPPLPICAVTS
jgi:hypothetical protein